MSRRAREPTLSARHADTPSGDTPPSARLGGPWRTILTTARQLPNQVSSRRCGTSGVVKTLATNRLLQTRDGLRDPRRRISARYRPDSTGLAIARRHADGTIRDLNRARRSASDGGNLEDRRAPDQPLDRSLRMTLGPVRRRFRGTSPEPTPKPGRPRRNGVTSSPKQGQRLGRPNHSNPAPFSPQKTGDRAPTRRYRTSKAHARWSLLLPGRTQKCAGARLCWPPACIRDFLAVVQSRCALFRAVARRSILQC